MNLFLLPPFLRGSFAGASVTDYLWCGGLILFALLFKKPFSVLLARHTSGLAVRATGGKYRGLFKSLIRKPVEWLFAVVIIFIGLSHLAGPLGRLTLFHFQRKSGAIVITAASIADHLFFFFAILFTALTLSRLVDFIYRSQVEHAYQQKQAARTQILPLLKELVKGLLWTIAFFWILGVVFEVNIPALITGLGIGGVALALAAKESIENLFASLTILTDKPFQVGDTIKVGTLEGVVQRIGFRSARLRGADGSLYIIPNKKLVDENLENLTQRDTQGIKVLLNIKYGLPEEALQQMIEALKDMIRKTLHVIEPVRVSVEHFNENAFQLALYYHLPEPLAGDGNEAAIREEINRKTYGIIMKYTGTAKLATQAADGPAAPGDPEAAKEAPENS
jgi:MscS family membrane protein